jgi:hypothetical protein
MPAMLSLLLGESLALAVPSTLAGQDHERAGRRRGGEERPSVKAGFGRKWICSEFA